MTVMLLGKLRGMPTHTDIITDFDFREVCQAMTFTNPENLRQEIQSQT
jgi:hypothetical protein